MQACRESGNKAGRRQLPCIGICTKTVLIAVIIASMLINLCGCGSSSYQDEERQISGSGNSSSSNEDTVGTDGPRATSETETAVNAASEPVSLEEASVGDTVHLGEISFNAHDAGKDLLQNNDYGWLVLAVEGNRVLLIAEGVIDKRPYHLTHEDVFWENSTIRQWLNTEFFAALPASARERIVETEIINSANAEYGTSGGNPTRDCIFLLSAEEAEAYFSSDSQREAALEIRGDSENTAIWRWWLRSPGSTNANAAVVGGPILFDDRGATERYSDGRVLLEGDGVNRNIGVRPAFWIERS